MTWGSGEIPTVFLVQHGDSGQALHVNPVFMLPGYPFRQAVYGVKPRNRCNDSTAWLSSEVDVPRGHLTAGTATMHIT